MSIHLILGPMFGGKTKELIRRHEEAVQRSGAIFCVKPRIDDRYSDSAIVAHDGSRIPARPVNSLSEIALDLQEARAAGRECEVFVDEGQFLPCLALSATIFAEIYGARIHIAALNGDFLRRPWPVISELIPVTSTVTWMADQPCKTCDAKAARFTAKLGLNPRPDLESAVDVGGAEKYVALCESCYIQKSNLYAGPK